MGKILRIFYSVFYITYVVITFFFAAGSGFLISFFIKDRAEYRFKHSKAWFRYFVLPPSLNKIKISGLQNIPKNKPVIFVSNHGSYFDVPIYLAYLPGSFRFIVREGLFKIPFIGPYIRLSGHMSIDRAGGAGALKTLNKAKAVLAQGKSIVIFPEGTRSADGSLGKFKRGSLILAFDTGVPIVPIGISGSHRVMPKGSALLNPSKIKVNIGKPVYLGKIKTAKKGDYEAALEKVRSEISKLLEI